jgi:hypothetical protein
MKQTISPLLPVVRVLDRAVSINKRVEHQGSAKSLQQLRRPGEAPRARQSRPSANAPQDRAGGRAVGLCAQTHSFGRTTELLLPEGGLGSSHGFSAISARMSVCTLRVVLMKETVGMLETPESVPAKLERTQLSSRAIGHLAAAEKRIWCTRRE